MFYEEHGVKFRGIFVLSTHLFLNNKLIYLHGGEPTGLYLIEMLYAYLRCFPPTPLTKYRNLEG
jgi:hypothetical protein